MREWLLKAKDSTDAEFRSCAYVFRKGVQPIKFSVPDWKAACDAAGVPKILFHDLRRTAVRNMVRAGVPEIVAMQISGHKTCSVFDRYNIVLERDLRGCREDRNSLGAIETAALGHNSGHIRRS
jgi:integrase